MSLANIYNLSKNQNDSTNILYMFHVAFRTKVENTGFNEIPPYQIESTESYENSSNHLDFVLDRYIKSNLDFLIIVELVNTNKTCPTYFALLKNDDDFGLSLLKTQKLMFKKVSVAVYV